ncbi:MAG: hypothetical protein ABIQ90_01495 [Polaromonas sp.]
MSNEFQDSMWLHYCVPEGTTIGLIAGELCKWCDAVPTMTCNEARFLKPTSSRFAVSDNSLPSKLAI